MIHHNQVATGTHQLASAMYCQFLHAAHQQVYCSQIRWPLLCLQVMPYSTGCTTPLSNFEAGLNYKDVPDPAVKVSFPLDDDEDNAEMVIWTTTPW